MTVDSKTGSKSISKNRKPQSKSKFKKSPDDRSRPAADKRTSRFGDKTTTKKTPSRFNDDSRPFRDNKRSEKPGRDAYRDSRKSRLEIEDRKKDLRDRPDPFENRNEFKDRDFPRKRHSTENDDRGDHRFGNASAKERRPPRFKKPFEKRTSDRTGERSRGSFFPDQKDGDKPRYFQSDRSDFKRTDRKPERRFERSSEGRSDRGFESRSDRGTDRSFDRSFERRPFSSPQSRPDMRPKARQDRWPNEKDAGRRSNENFKDGKSWKKPADSRFNRNSPKENSFESSSGDRQRSSAFKSSGSQGGFRRQEMVGQESPRPFHEKPRRIGPISRTEQDPRTRPMGKRILEVQSEGPCQIKNECRSCLYVNLPYESSLKLKHGDGIRKLDVFVGKAIIHEPVPSPKPLYYRTHVKLAVRRNQEGGADIGLFEPGSHKVVNLDQCPVQSGVINHFIRKFRIMVDEMGIEPYEESTAEGWLRYIAIRVAHLTGELMVSLIVTRHDEALGKKIHQFLRKNEEKFSSLHFNIQPEVGNAIWGAETIHIGGEKTLSESLCGLKFEISPQSFFQINPPQAQNLYRTVERYAANPTGQPVAWDLYSGCGQITMLLSRAGYRALGIEEIPAAVENAKSNALRNKLSAEFILGRVEDKQFKLPSWAQKPSLIVANPSRRGMAETTRKVLAGVAVDNRSTFIYVSCDVDTLARDLKDLTEGGLKVRQVHSFDMFAQTAGLEWLVVLTP